MNAGCSLNSLGVLVESLLHQDIHFGLQSLLHEYHRLPKRHCVVVLVVDFHDQVLGKESLEELLFVVVLNPEPVEKDFVVRSEFSVGSSDRVAGLAYLYGLEHSRGKKLVFDLHGLKIVGPLLIVGFDTANVERKGVVEFVEQFGKLVFELKRHSLHLLLLVFERA